MPESLDLATPRLHRDQLTAAIAQIHDMRPDRSPRAFWRCGKPSYHCAKKGDKGHGPSYSLTHPVAGKTITHIIPTGLAVERTREQLEEYHRFRERSRTRKARQHRQRRERREHFGELVQLDGSFHEWLEGRGRAAA